MKSFEMELGFLLDEISLLDQVCCVEYRRLDVPLRESFAISGGATESANLLLLRLKDQRGRLGYGEAAPFPAYDGIERGDVLDSLLGTDLSFFCDPASSSSLSASLQSLNMPGPLLAAFEMALLDLYGRQRNIPVYEFLGDSMQDFQTGMTIVVGDVDHSRESALRYLGQGFRNLKVKLSGNVALDISRLRVIRSVAPDCRLLLDANGAFDIDRALELVDQISEHRLEVSFLEQPFPSGCELLNAELSYQCSIPILADESCTSEQTVIEALDDFGFEGVNLKIQKSGVEVALKMRAAAVERGAKLMIGGMVESPLSMTCSAHIVKAFGGFDWVDLDTPLFMRDHPFQGGIDFDGDSVLLSEEAGLGVQVAEEFSGFVDSDWSQVWQGAS